MKLRTWRKRQKLTQQEVADKLGTSQALVAKWELGTHTPSIRSAGKIFAVTKGAVTLKDLLAVRSS
jgi:transcriptional regulator with XRE-family HTH domain